MIVGIVKGAEEGNTLNVVQMKVAEENMSAKRTVSKFPFQFFPEQTNSRPYEPDPERTHTPASPYGAEWYGSAMDICRVHAALQAAATGPAAPVRDILSAVPGIDLDTSKWTYIAAKGGNLPGDLTFSWYAEDRSGQPWVVSFQLNWPSYRSQTAAAWLLSIATQSFGLLPVS